MGLECPTRLYFERHPGYPSNKQGNELINHIRFNNQQLTALTKSFFPSGQKVEAGSRKENAEKTAHYLSNQTDIQLFDAVLAVDNLYYRCPILTRNNHRIDLYKIKTKAINPRKHRFTGSDGTIHSKWKPYFTDLAFGMHIAERLLDSLSIHFHLVLPDKTEVTNLNFQSYFNIDKEDTVRPKHDALTSVREHITFLEFMQVDPWVAKIQNGEDKDQNIHPAWEGIGFDDRIREMAGIYEKNDRYPSNLDMHCRSCPFRVSRKNLAADEKSGFDECWSELVPMDKLKNGQHIFNLTGHGTESHLKNNILTLDQVSVPHIGKKGIEILQEGNKISFEQRQLLQVLGARGEEVPTEFVKKKLIEELKQLKFPLYFLDFEAANFAVPLREGGSPYESLAFQFSCHVLENDGTLVHHDWIQREPGQYPNYELIRKLMDIPNFAEGTVLQYSPFEKQMIKDIRRTLEQDKKREQAPEDHKLLSGWLDRVVEGTEAKPPTLFVDMNRLVRDYYYHRRMNGSFGLKEVIAAMVSESETLRRKYSTPYQSDNFDSIRWWQMNEVDQAARDPYAVIEDRGGRINKGDEALMAFIRLQRRSMSSNERSRMVDALLKYCELDTLSMVMMYQHWREMET